MCSWSRFISLKGKLDNLSSVQKSEASSRVVAIEYLCLAWFPLSNLVFCHSQANMNVFTFLHCPQDLQSRLSKTRV